MIPILYNTDEKVFSHNGIGALKESLKCSVFEERNGAFDLELEYPIGGYWFKELRESRIILAKPDDESEPHAFRIYDVIKNL